MCLSATLRSEVNVRVKGGSGCLVDPRPPFLLGPSKDLALYITAISTPRGTRHFYIVGAARPRAATQTRVYRVKNVPSTLGCPVGDGTTAPGSTVHAHTLLPRRPVSCGACAAAP